MKEIIQCYIKNKETEKLEALLASAEEIDILYAFYDLSSKEQVLVFRLLTKNTAMSVFDQLNTRLQSNLIRSFTDEGVTELVKKLAPDDRVKLLDEMPAGVAKKLIDSLPPEKRDVTNILMGYKPKTAGHIMTTEYISLNRDMTMEEAIEKIRRQAKDTETVYVLFVTDDSRKLEGITTLKELLIADWAAKVEDIMQRAVVKVYTNTGQEEAAHLLERFDLLAIPVVDSEERLIGIITIDDAVDILEEEASEDIYDHAGLADVTGSEADRSKVLINGSMWSIWKVRLPFLLITLAAGVLCGSIISGFEETLQSIAAVAVFIPLIMDMGGNVGTQSTTIFVRGMALGDIKLSNFLKHFLKEAGIGLSIGLLVGTVSGVIAAVWQGIPMLGLAVGMALAVSMTLAAVLGFFVPYVLIKLNVDQAAGSAPIITSIKDMVGLIVYFALVNAFLGHLMG